MALIEDIIVIVGEFHGKERENLSEMNGEMGSEGSGKDCKLGVKEPVQGGERPWPVVAICRQTTYMRVCTVRTVHMESFPTLFMFPDSSRIEFKRFLSSIDTFVSKNKRCSIRK